MPLPLPCQKELAALKHQYSLDELKHRENQLQAQLENEQDLQKELEEHRVPSARGGPTSPLPALAPGCELATRPQSSQQRSAEPRKQALCTHTWL